MHSFAVLTKASLLYGPRVPRPVGGYKGQPRYAHKTVAFVRQSEAVLTKAKLLYGASLICKAYVRPYKSGAFVRGN